jgi:alkylation response protein AidB-like acyl-CoA dehydrogenase
MIHASGPSLATAAAIADDLLFPAAAQVDLSGQLPASHLDALAAAGLYGAQGPPDLGRTDDFQRVVEVLAAGCLTTTFVWIQHHGAVRAVAAGPDDLRRRWLRPLCTGATRSAVAQAGVRPGPPALRATRVPGGFQFDGEAPWVTGWGYVQVIHTAARMADDTVVWALVDAVAGPALAVEPLRLAAVDASRTVLMRFDRLFVPDDRVTAVMPLAEWPARDAAGLRTNGSLSLGATRRCVSLLEPAAPEPAAVLMAELDAARSRLDAATPADLPPARAAASELALRSAATLAVAAGARGVLAGEHAQRLLREAAFLLVFASRPAIRTELFGLVGRPPAQ